MQPKEKSTAIVASSVNFESFSENFTFALKTLSISSPLLMRVQQ